MKCFGMCSGGSMEPHFGFYPYHLTKCFVFGSLGICGILSSSTYSCSWGGFSPLEFDGRESSLLISLLDWLGLLSMFEAGFWLLLIDYGARIACSINFVSSIQYLLIFSVLSWTVTILKGPIGFRCSLVNVCSDIDSVLLSVENRSGGL